MTGPVTGKAAVLLMLADPVSHIRGTSLINDSFAALGLDAVIVPLHVAPADLDGVLRAVRLMRNVAGLGITIPHKVAACSLVDGLTPVAARMGATNFVRRNADGTLTGTNTDGAGFLAGLRANGFDPAGIGVRFWLERGAWGGPLHSRWLRREWRCWK